MKYSTRTQFPVVFFVSAVLFTALMFGQSTLTHLNVSSVRKAAKSELPLTSSGPGEKWIVRFRLELSAEQGAYLLVLGPKGAPPLGYGLERRSSGTVWRDLGTGRSFTKSPGSAKLVKEPGARWVFLPPSAAYEWEVVDGRDEASADASRTVLIRWDMASAPIELVSPWYSVH